MELKGGGMKEVASKTTKLIPQQEVILANLQV
jgi:hypothetical protein